MSGSHFKTTEIVDSQKNRPTYSLSLFATIEDKKKMKNWGVFFYLHLDWWGNFPSSLKWNTKTTEKESILTRLGKLSGHQIFSAANTPVWSTPKCEPVEDVSETEKTPLRIHRKPKIKGLKLRSCKILQFFVTSRWRMVLLAGHHGTFLISDHEARLHRFR